jgi:tetratricopeptide (TPR) repeat protein
MLKQGNPLEARQWISKALTWAPMDPQNWEWYALILLKLEQPRAAFRTATRCLQLDPTRSFPYTIMAEVYRQLGDAPRAVNAWHRYLERNPASVVALMALVDIHAQREERQLLDEAVASLALMKKGGSWREFVERNTADPEWSAYVPDTDRLLLVVACSLEGQGRTVLGTPPSCSGAQQHY